MRWILLPALLALPVTATAQERMRAGDFRAMSPQQIADAILPSGHAPIARVAFDRFGGPMPPSPSFAATVHGLRFYSSSTPISADFCIQNEIVAEITPMPDADEAWLDAPPQLVRQAKGRQLYRYRAPGTACDGTRPHFAVDGMPDQAGLEAVRVLIGAAMRAETRAPLSYTVSCDAETCSDARKEMRDLPYGEIISVTPVPDTQRTGRDRFSRLSRMPGRTAIGFGMPIWGARRIDIGAVLYRGRIEHVAISESFIVF